MKTAFFDCFAGISGDMTIGAFLDAGLPLDWLQGELDKLDLPEYEISAEKVLKLTVPATKFTVHTTEKKLVRTWPNIKELIEDSPLPDKVKDRAIGIFSLMAEAEAKIHRKRLDQVHFHEIGAVDAIIDVVGTVLAIDHLGIETVYSSPVATGIGLTRTEHGVLPVPSPAALDILEGTAIYSASVPAELVTPTGAAIIKSYARSFIEIPPMTVEAVGYGAGSRDLEIPNVLRVIVGEAIEAPATQVALLETNIDNARGETLGFLMERLLNMGALDVWFTPIVMKKSRPAVSLSALVPLGNEQTIAEAIATEAGVLGLRISKEERWLASRETLAIETSLGPAHVKVGKIGDKVINIAPEFEDCRRLADEHGLPLKEVSWLVEREAREKLGLASS